MLHEKMMELLAKKKADSGSLDPMERDAKLGVLGQVKKMAASAMGDKLGNLKKVVVSSNDPSGLESGLDKAKELVAAKDGMPEEGATEDADDMLGEEDEPEMGSEDIDAQIEKLLALKARMHSK